MSPDLRRKYELFPPEDTFYMSSAVRDVGDRKVLGTKPFKPYEIKITMADFLTRAVTPPTPVDVVTEGVAVARDEQPALECATTDSLEEAVTPPTPVDVVTEGVAVARDEQPALECATTDSLEEAVTPPTPVDVVTEAVSIDVRKEP